MKKRAVYMIFFTLVFGFSSPVSTAFAETAKNNYRLYCSQCHGLTGNGAGINKSHMGVTPRDHTNATEMAKLKDADLYTSIAQGGAAVSKSPLMSPWDGVLTEAEIKEMVKYLRKLCNCQGKP